MATELPIEIVPTTTADTIKSALSTLNEQSVVIKGLMNTLRNVLKDTERQSKEIEKLKNKRTRVKTERSANSLPSGITKPVAISDELAKFLGVAPGTLVPRNEVTKGVSGFVKNNELSDPANKQRFVLDDRPAAKALRVLLGNPSEDVTYFNLQRYLKHHYIFDKPVDQVPVDSAPAVEKKKVLVKKKKVPGLTEDTS